MNCEIFDYQDRLGSRLLSYIILLLCIGVTLLVRQTVGNSLVTIFCFVFSLILFSLIGVFVNRRLFIHEAEYELSPERLVIRAGKQRIELTPGEVNGVGLDPIYERGSKGTDTVKCWQLSLLTIKGKYHFYSVNVLDHNDDNLASIHRFKSLGRELKHWVGMV